MATKNDITGDSIISKTNTDKYRDNFAAVFKKEHRECKRCGEINPAEIHTCTPKEAK
jgi:hypothetical protein